MSTSNREATKPTVLLTRRLPTQVVSRLEGLANVAQLEGEGPGALVAAVATAWALVPMVTDVIGRDVIEAGRNLKLIANVGVGYNNIDVAAAGERGIVVTNTPGVLSGATADLTWALILSVTRRLSEGERLLRRGAWPGWAFDQLLGMELDGKTIGIVGYGRIGREVARRATAFGMRVVHTGTGDAGLPLDQLLSCADIVSLHVPLRPETHHLIDQTALARMKRNAYLINTSRGPVVDETALVWALRNSMIAGAALDVYEQEPRVHPDLLSLENVVLAPHLGSATTETRTAMADLAIRNVVAMLQGQPPVTPVG